MTFNKKLLAATLLTVGGFAAISSTNAATATATMGVQATVTETCDVVAGSDINLGDIVAGATGTTGETATAIKVNCSNLTPYNLGLSTSTGADGTGVMLGGNDNAEKIPYNMFSDLSHTTAWGGTVGMNTVTGTGDGMLTPSQEHILYITADATDVSKGIYEDTITVTVTY